MFIEGNKKDLYLDACVVKKEMTTMILKNVTVFWKFKNITSNIDVTLGSGSSERDITFEEGYWTFDMIRAQFNSFSVSLEALRHNNKCRIKPDGDDLNLGKLGPLLGFPENEVVSDGVWKTSPKVVDVNLGLRYINIDCDVINTTENSDTKGKRSYPLATIPVTTEQSLNGSVSVFRGIDSEVVINNGCFNRLVFVISSNIDKNVEVNIETLLELYIT